jgi:hypothetical protein
MKLPLAGLIDNFAMSVYPDELSLWGWPGYVAYTFSNVVGIVSTGNGKRLREYAAEGVILAISIDPSTRKCFILTMGAEQGDYRVIELPFDSARSSEVCHLGSSNGVMQLLASRGRLVVSYLEANPELASQQAKLLVFDQGSTEPKISHGFEAGLVRDIAELPEPANELLVAVSRSVDSLGNPTGWSELHLVKVEEGVVERVARYRQPILFLSPFKNECLVLLRGGNVISYSPEHQATANVCRMPFDYLQSSLSRDRNCLAVVSSTERYTHGEPGQPMQVMVLK